MTTEDEQEVLDLLEEVQSLADDDDNTYKNLDIFRSKDGMQHLWIPEDFDEAVGEIASILYVLRTARPEDKLTVYCSGFGGSTMTGMKVVNSIRECLGEVVVQSDSDCYSMHTLIALCADNVLINDNVMFMFHDLQMSLKGDINRTETQIKAYKKISRGVDKDILAKVLTKHEMNLMYKGQEIYLTGADINERLYEHEKLR